MGSIPAPDAYCAADDIRQKAHMLICETYDRLAIARGKYEGATWAQIQGFRKELGDTVSSELENLMEAVETLLNPAMEYPGALVTMYYNKHTGEREA